MLYIKLASNQSMETYSRIQINQQGRIYGDCVEREHK